MYLYRTVDRNGKMVDFCLSRKRNVAAAKAFLRKAIRSQAMAPTSITLDGYAASHRAVRELQEQGEVPKTAKLRSFKYLNNVIEQDHRNIKLRLGPMLGFKQFKSATITIAGIELMHRIRKGQFALSRLDVQGQIAPAVWESALAACFEKHHDADHLVFSEICTRTSSLILGCSRCLQLITWRANPDVETTNWRARRGKTAQRVRREGTARAVPPLYPPARSGPRVFTLHTYRASLRRADRARDRLRREHGRYRPCFRRGPT